MSDNLHPNAALYSDIGAGIASLLAAATTASVSNPSTRPGSGLLAPLITLATAPAASNASTAILGTVSAGSAGDSLTVSLTSDATFASGSAIALIDGVLIYTPGLITAALAGADTISYVVTDDSTGTQTAQTQSVALSPACFASGTRIHATRGDIAVEDLVAGDRVVTEAGGTRGIVWIGHRHLDLARQPDPEAARPVRIMAGAFAEDAPRRDLFLSPEHAVYLAAIDALVPIRCLVNGTTIAPDDAAAEVTYYHLELDRHDVVLAEGLPAESWLDTGSRAAFENAPVAALFPTFVSPPADIYAAHGYARLLEAGPEIDTARAMLARRAAAIGHPVAGEMTLRVSAAGRVEATLDPGTRFVRIRSASGFVGADLRRLGALVTDVAIGAARVDMADRRLRQGFHETEQHGAQCVRWTDGDAVIDLGAGAAERAIAFTVSGLVARDARAAA
jgi:hypothetical protein